MWRKKKRESACEQYSQIFITTTRILKKDRESIIVGVKEME